MIEELNEGTSGATLGGQHGDLSLRCFGLVELAPCLWLGFGCLFVSWSLFIVHKLKSFGKGMI